MQENILSYSETVNYFGRQKVSDRYKFLYDKMKEYISVRQAEEKLMIQESILQQAVMDYFVDIYRLKEFHKIDKIDISQILAYEAYWILRRKPLIPLTTQGDSNLVFANEGFVTTFIAHEFLIPMEESEALTPEEEEKFLKYLRNFHYYLKYRSVDKQAMEAMLNSYKTGRSLRDA